MCDSKAPFLEPEVEFILSVTVSFVVYIDVAVEATACTHSANKIRYDKADPQGIRNHTVVQ